MNHTYGGPALTENRLPATDQMVGYDVHVTRRANWYDEEGAEITEDEWRAYVEHCDDLEESRDLGDDFAIWTAYTGDYEYAWFQHSDGNISTKGPDDEILTRMLQIAEHFEARVQGDDGELYDAAGVSYPDEKSNKPAGWLGRLIQRFRSS